MKKLFFTLALAISGCALYAQTNAFYPAPGKIAEYTVKVTSPMGNQELISVQQSQITGKTIEVKNDMKMTADGDVIQSVSVRYQDMGDYYIADLKEAFSSLLGSLGEFSLDSISGDLRFPKTLKVGETYPDVKAKVSVSAQGMSLTLDILVSGRGIDLEETIEVPAGKFECFRFVEKTNVNVMGQEQVSEMISWYSPGVGLVKQQGSVQNGQISTVTELQSIK